MHMSVANKFKGWLFDDGFFGYKLFMFALLAFIAFMLWYGPTYQIIQLEEELHLSLLETEAEVARALVIASAGCYLDGGVVVCEPTEAEDD